MSNRIRRPIFAVLLCLLGFLVPRIAPAAEPPPNVADLERRVRELEELVQQMRAERASSGATTTAVNALPQTPPPSTEAATQPSALPSPGGLTLEDGSAPTP